MNVASRAVNPGKTRACPHCKATILESLSICPGCLHHLRFDQEAAKRQVAATSALRVEGVIRHPASGDALEYFVVISVRNDRGEEVTRQVVSVGALQSTEKRTFALSVEMLPAQAPAVPNAPKPGTPAAGGAPRSGTPPAASRPAGAVVSQVGRPAASSAQVPAASGTSAAAKPAAGNPATPAAPAAAPVRPPLKH